MAQPIHFVAVVERVDRYGDDVCTYRIRSAERLTRFLPGQFIHLAIDPYDPSSYWPPSRAFSVANSIEDHHTIELTISRQGAFTNRVLDEINVGSLVWGKGPYGHFNLCGTPEDRTMVLIAGGTGVTPFASFMDYALTRQSLTAKEVILHYGARSRELLIYRELAERCVGAFQKFKARYYVEEGTETEKTGIVLGTLDIDRIFSETPDRDRAAYFISGPKQMIRTFERRLVEANGISRAQVLIDAWD